jgi:hypothetical protein
MNYKAAELSDEEIERLKQLEQDLAKTAGENVVVVAYTQDQVDHADKSLNPKKI